MSSALYPVFLKLAGRRVVVVGAGPVAASKLEGLLAAGAEVVVVAPAIVPEIRARIPAERLVERGFEPGDLDGASWVVAAAPPEVNAHVAEVATARGLFVNAVDDKDAASAFLGGVIRRGPVELAISTGGTAPALAGLLREALEALLPDELERWIEVAHAKRAEWKASRIPMAARRPALLRALDELYSPGVQS